MVPEANEPPARVEHRADPARFYRRRQRVSMVLLCFVVVVGLPIIGVPQLRNRLSTRVMALKTAMSGEIKPATLEVGANLEPFPAEYERPEPVIPRPPELPQPQRVFTMTPSTVYRPGAEPAAVPAGPAPAFTEPAGEPAVEAAETEPELKYQKGEVEQDAYDLLLKSNAAVAGMVQGSNPALKFKSWDAASRGDGVYWVRLRFQSDGNPDVEYIWQVKLQSNEVMPLSHNARSIS